MESEMVGIQHETTEEEDNVLRRSKQRKKDRFEAMESIHEKGSASANAGETRGKASYKIQL